MELTTVDGKKFYVDSILGSGGFGTVHSGRDKKTNQLVAIKIEHPKGKKEVLGEVRYEQSMYSKLKGVSGIPKFYGWGQEPNFLVLELLGPSISDYLHHPELPGVLPGSRLEIGVIVAIGFQLIGIIAQIHARELVYSDFKSANILIGLNSRVYLTDLGLVSKYIWNGKHVLPKREPGHYNGTVEYISRDVHRRLPLSRRGDLESIGYLFVRWYIGTLPWKELSNESDIVKSKEQFWESIPHLHPTIRLYLDIVNSLGYDQTPNYAELQNLLSIPR